MLGYIGTGKRTYDKHPVKLLQRPYWEFQAVIAGEIAMLGQNGPELFHSQNLWLSAPHHLHGWIGMPDAQSEVVVFHYLTLPEPLLRLIPEHGCLSIPLNPSACRRLVLLATEVRDSLEHPTPANLMRHEHALLELSLLVYETCSVQALSKVDNGSKRVQRALEWFAKNLEANPSIESVALATGTSVAHLRRSFHAVMKASPKKILDEVRYRRALQLMADDSVKLSAVSTACGFGSPSAFSRAFKHKFGSSPESWRSRRDCTGKGNTALT